MRRRLVDLLCLAGIRKYFGLSFRPERQGAPAGRKWPCTFFEARGRCAAYPGRARYNPRRHAWAGSGGVDFGLCYHINFGLCYHIHPYQSSKTSNPSDLFIPSHDRNTAALRPLMVAQSAGENGVLTGERRKKMCAAQPVKTPFSPAR
jgi:hypothetical protein